MLLATSSQIAAQSKVFFDGGISRRFGKVPILGRLYVFLDHPRYHRHHESLHPYWTRLPQKTPDVA